MTFVSSRGVHLPSLSRSFRSDCYQTETSKAGKGKINEN